MFLQYTIFFLYNVRKQKMLNVLFCCRSQSKASVLASRRDRDRVVPDSDTGSYKRTMSPNGHAIPAEVLAESPKINTRETIWPNKTKKEVQKNNNNNNSSIFRRVSMNEKPNKSKSFKCDENEDLKKANLVLPDVLPVNALTNRSHYGRTSYPFATSEDGDNMRKSPPKTPPSSPPKSPSRGSPFAPLKTTNLSSTTSFIDRLSTPSLPVTRTRNTPVPVSSASTPLRVNTFTSVETSSPMTNDAPKPDSPKLSPLSTKTTSVSTSPASPRLPSPPIKQQLSPSSPIRSSPLRLSTSSSSSSSPLQIPSLNNTTDSPPASPKKSEGCPPVIEGLQMIQRTEVILRVNTTTSDAASQTEKEELPPTPLPSRRKLQEEIECDLLSEDIISHLSSSDKLKDILGMFKRK